MGTATAALRLWHCHSSSRNGVLLFVQRATTYCLQWRWLPPQSHGTSLRSCLLTVPHPFVVCRFHVLRLSPRPLQRTVGAAAVSNATATMRLLIMLAVSESLDRSCFCYDDIYDVDPLLACFKYVMKVQVLATHVHSLCTCIIGIDYSEPST